MKVGTDAMILGAYVGKSAKSNYSARSESAESANYRILDIGTGTGVLSLMLAQKAKAQIHAIDINESSYLQSKENFENSSWRNRIHAFHSSIQDFNTGDNQKYDLIISNPPYFEHNQKASKESERYNERTNARSFDKLSFSDLLVHAERLLDEEGVFYVIIPAVGADSFISEAWKNNMFLFDRLHIQSKENQEPVRVILGFVKNKKDLKETTLVIYRDDRGYTDDYIELTKNYYARDMVNSGT